MDDIKKVNTGLKCLADVHDGNCAGCGYSEIAIYPVCVRQVSKDALSVIEELQAENERLQPKKGKWIEIESQTGVGAFGFNEVTVNAFRCSECRKKIDVSDGNFKYCPYCGADMREGDGE